MWVEWGVIFGGNFKETKSHYLEESHNYSLWLSISHKLYAPFGPVKWKMPNRIGSHYDCLSWKPSQWALVFFHLVHKVLVVCNKIYVYWKPQSGRQVFEKYSSNPILLPFGLLVFEELCFPPLQWQKVQPATMIVRPIPR